MSRKLRNRHETRRERRILNRSEDTLKISGRRLASLRHGDGLSRMMLSRELNAS